MLIAHQKDFIFKAALGAALMNGVVVSAYGLYLLLVGMRQIRASETSVVETWLAPHPGGYFSLLGGGLLLLGLWARNATITWVGWMVIAMFSGMFVFNVGIPLIPVSVLLLLLLGIMAWANKLDPQSVSQKLPNMANAHFTKDSIFPVSLGATFMFAMGMGAYGLYLTQVGIRQVSSSETWLQPYPAGYILLFGAALLVFGLLIRKRTIVWMAGVVVAMFVILHLSILGGIWISISVFLMHLFLLSIMTWTGKLK